MVTKIQIKAHLERLYRHYTISSKTYDYPAMLDLSHSLRVLTELIDEITQVTDKVFTTSEPHIKFKRLLKTADHIYFHLPNPIVTYTKGIRGEMRETFFFPAYIMGKDKQSEISIDFRPGKKPNEMYFNHLFIMKRKLDDKEFELYKQFSKKNRIKKKRYNQYMNDNFIFFKMKDHKYTSISRKELIETVANEYSASHARKEGFKKHKFTDPVKDFMDFKLAGLPIPYFALLHIADDILKCSDQIINSISNS